MYNDRCRNNRVKVSSNGLLFRVLRRGWWLTFLLILITKDEGWGRKYT
jgi:hypothetical protein